MTTIQDGIEDVLERNKSRKFTNAQLAKRLCVPEPSIRKVTYKMVIDGIVRSTDSKPYAISYRNPSYEGSW